MIAYITLHPVDVDSITIDKNGDAVIQMRRQKGVPDDVPAICIYLPSTWSIVFGIDETEMAITM